MELAAILIRTTVMYFFIFLVMRLMGKREIGKLSVFDLVIPIMIAEIAVIVIETSENSMLNAIAPIMLLVLIQIAISFFSLKSRNFRMLFDGKPSILIRDGHLNRKEMLRMRYNLDDLMLQLRENQIMDIGEVELAVLESTGKLSVLKKDDQNDGEDEVEIGRSPKFRYEMLPLPLIMDGQVQDDNLEKLGKTRFWLKSELQQFDIDNFKQVYYCSIDHKGKIYIDKK